MSIVHGVLVAVRGRHCRGSRGSGLTEKGNRFILIFETLFANFKKALSHLITTFVDTLIHIYCQNLIVVHIPSSPCPSLLLDSLSTWLTHLLSLASCPKILNFKCLHWSQRWMAIMSMRMLRMPKTIYTMVRYVINHETIMLPKLTSLLAVPLSARVTCLQIIDFICSCIHRSEPSSYTKRERCHQQWSNGRQGKRATCKDNLRNKQSSKFSDDTG